MKQSIEKSAITSYYSYIVILTYANFTVFDQVAVQSFFKLKNVPKRCYKRCYGLFN